MQQLLAGVAGAVARGVAALEAEVRRGQWENELWAVPPDGGWALLATDARPSAMPTEFEKARGGAPRATPSPSPQTTGIDRPRRWRS